MVFSFDCSKPGIGYTSVCGCSLFLFVSVKSHFRSRIKLFISQKAPRVVLGDGTPKNRFLLFFPLKYWT